ncbi:uncharacterized protein LOC113569824 isoform X3 [Electrophorus electricus]|uniref:uncharacterized protein LOC113569824 isoform X3 n=1 Tax=Electrophorus electricus TaxID=8005 RepID=UPI0015D0AF99|nr:uncharacterized protein LOC113569824 isoform X3 [Electrophorus electricus]
MTKLQLLHRALNERLMAAVEQIMEMVGGTVLEYEEETVRARKENEILRRRLRWMEGENPTDWPGEAEVSGLEQQPVTLAVDPALEPLAIKTEPIDTCDSQSFTPDSSLVAPANTTNLELVDPGMNAPTDAGLPDGALWDSAHSYMAPLDFDPTMVRHWRGRGRSQRMSFACPDCGKVFGREHRLIIHMRIHSSERPYTYRRRKACFYGDKTRKKKLHRISKTSREIVDELSDGSEQTERSTGLDDISTSTTPAPSAPEVEPDEAAGEANQNPEASAARPVGLRARQGGARTKMPRCVQCKRVFTHVSRLAVHMKTHRKPLPTHQEHEEQEGTDKTDRRSRQHPKKAVMRNNEAEVERARAGGHTLFQCSECKKVFARSCWLTFHLKSHERERVLARKERKQRQVPGSRMQRSVPQGSPEPTKEITKEATAENSKVHVLKKIFACPYCDKVFAREGWLGPHIRSHTSKTPQKSGIFPDNIIPGSTQRRTRRTIVSQSFQQLEEDTTEVKSVTEDSKRKNENSEKIKEQPKAKNVELNKNYTESERNSETKRIGNESERTIDKTNKIPDESKTISKEPSGGMGGIRSKKSYPCRQCGKVYLLAGCLKTHKKMHRRERILRLMEEQRQIERSAEGQSLEEEEEEEEENIGERKPKRSKRVLEIQQKLGKRRSTKKQHLDKSPQKNEDKPSDDQPAEAKSIEAATKAPGRCVCKHCGKVYARRNWLNLHILGHRKQMLALQQDSDEMQKNDDEQTSQGSSSTEDSAVQKGKDGGKASFPCPFCEKAFPRAMRLMVHMQIHSGEKPYPYRQRKEQFYGDLTRPRGPSSDSQEPAIENTDEREEDEGITVTRNQTSAVSQDHTSTTEPMETIQPQSVCTGRKLSLLPPQSAGAATTSHSTTHSRTDSKSVSNAISHFSLQPRIVLEPITAEPKHWTASGEDDFSVVSAGTSDVEQHQNVDVADAAKTNAIDYQVNPPQIPLENLNTYDYLDSQNPLSSISYTVLSETDDPDIVCVKLGSFCKSLENASFPPTLVKGEVESAEIEVEPELSGTQINSPSVKSGFTGTVYSVAKNGPPFSEPEKGSNDRALISDSNSTDIILTTVPEFLLAESSSSAMHQEADTEPVYMVVSDVDEDNNDDRDDDWLNVSNVLHEKKKRKMSTGSQMQIEQSGLKGTTISQSFQNPSSIEQVNGPLCKDPLNPALDKTAFVLAGAGAGAVDKTPVSSSEKATESVVFIPNETDEQSDHCGLLANKDKLVPTSIQQTEESCTDPKGWFTCVPCGLKLDSEGSLALHKKIHSLPGHTDKSSVFKKLKKNFKNNETKIKQPVGHMQTSEVGRDDSTDNPEISGERDSAMLVKVSADKPSEGCPDTDTSQSPRVASKALAVGKEPKKEKKPLYCRFCGKACRKIELHLKYDHSREPEVMEALRFSRTPEERKKLLSHLCSKEKTECDNTDVVRSGKAEDLVHCIFCKGSYMRNQFWKHALICEEKKTKELILNENNSSVFQPKPRLTQKTFEPESEKLIQDNICNTVQQTLPESLNVLLPETYPSTTQNSLTSNSPVAETASTVINPTPGPVMEDPPISYIGDSTVKMSIDSETSDPPILDSFPSAHMKVSIPDTGISIAKNINVELLGPPVLDSCHAAPEITQLELENPLPLNMGDGQEQKSPDSQCPPILESCHSTPQEVLDGECTCPLIDTGGILDIKQCTAELTSLPQFDARFDTAEQPLTSDFKSPSLLDPSNCDIHHNVGQHCQNPASQNLDCVRKCISSPESMDHPDITSSISAANKKIDRDAVPTTDSGDLQQTFDSEADAERTAMPKLGCTDSHLTPDQELEMIARPDTDKGHLDLESTNTLVPDCVGYETGDSIQVFESRENMASATETDSPPVLDHIPKETHETPGPETDRTYNPTKQMFDSQGHVRASVDEFGEVAIQDCDFKISLDSDTTTTVKRKWDNQSNAVKEDPKRSRLSNPLQKTSEECVASTSTETSEQTGPQTYTSNLTSLEDSEGNAKLYKTHYCFYCRKPCVRMTQHLQSMHPKEPDVAKALSYEKNSKERKQLLDLLRSKGDFLHNTDVVRSGEGSLVPSRQLATATSNEDYVLCIYCLELFSRRSVANHVQRCKQKYPDRAATSCSELLPITVSRSPIPTSNTGCTSENLKSAPESINSPLPDTSLSEELLKANPQSANAPNAGSSCIAGDEENPHEEYDGSLEGDQSIGSLEGDQSVGSLSETGHCGAQLDANIECTHSSPKYLGTSAEQVDLERGCDITSDTSLVTGQTGSDDTPDASQTGSDYVHKWSLCNHTDTNMSEEQKTEVEQSSQRVLERRRRSSRPHIQPMRLDDDSDEESVSHSTKVHVCEHCNATFCSPYHLRRHVYTHTGERPYWCSQCNMGFIQKYRFRNHRMMHHGETQLSLDQELARSRKKRSLSGEKPANNELHQQPLDEHAAMSPELHNPDMERAASTDGDPEEPSQSYT